MAFLRASLPTSQALPMSTPFCWPLVQSIILCPVSVATSHLAAVPQVRRLAKAARHADVLASLATQRGDTRTALEAQAYASLMTGTWLMEKETDWSTALKKLDRTQYAPFPGQHVHAATRTNDLHLWHIRQSFPGWGDTCICEYAG